MKRREEKKGEERKGGGRKGEERRYNMCSILRAMNSAHYTRHSTVRLSRFCYLILDSVLRI